jgi:hypothetical protein
MLVSVFGFIREVVKIRSQSTRMRTWEDKETSISMCIRLNKVGPKSYCTNAKKLYLTKKT